MNANQVQVLFDAPVRDVTADRRRFFYQDEVMVGGGIILQ